MVAVIVNFARRHLTASQKAAIAAELLPQYEEEAKERQKEHGSTSPGKPKITQGNNSLSDSGKASEQAAKAVGVNPRYVSDAKKLKEEAVAAVRESAKERQAKGGAEKVPQISGEPNKHSRETDTARAKLAGANRQ